MGHIPAWCALEDRVRVFLATGMLHHSSHLLPPARGKDGPAPIRQSPAHIESAIPFHMVVGSVMKSHRELWRTATLVVLALALLALARLAAQSRGTVRDGQPVNASAAVYDPDPSHPWNRVHNCLFIRHSADGADYGADTLDPLLWGPRPECPRSSAAGRSE